MKILWAIDIFENYPGAIPAAARFLGALNSRVQLEVDALSVMYPADRRPTAEKERGLRLLKMRLAGTQNEKWFGSAHVILGDSLAQRAAVADLVEFARNGDYDAILAIKHSKAGRPRALLGSFAEMLSYLTPLPLFLVNAEGFIPKSIRNLFIATDANPDCGQEFKKLSRFLPLDGTRIRLFHRVPFVLPDLTTVEDQEFYRKAETKRVSISLERIEKAAANLGAATETSIIQEKRPVERAALRAARKDNFDLMILNHKGKGALGFFLGKTTRKILQNADRPVLLFRA